MAHNKCEFIEAVILQQRNRAPKASKAALKHPDRVCIIEVRAPSSRIARKTENVKSKALSAYSCEDINGAKDVRLPQFDRGVAFHVEYPASNRVIGALDGFAADTPDPVGSGAMELF